MADLSALNFKPLKLGTALQGTGRFVYTDPYFRKIMQEKQPVALQELKEEGTRSPSQQQRRSDVGSILATIVEAVTTDVGAPGRSLDMGGM